MPMSDKQTVTPTPIIGTQGRASALLASVGKLLPNVSTSHSMLERYRYVDFVDPKHNRPILSLEWEFGGRGLWVGRLLHMIAKYSKGKSSFMFFMYACAQRLTSGAWCNHIETEGASAPPDFQASFGVDPKNLVVAEESSLESVLETVDTLEASIRGEWGITVDPETGKKVKSKFQSPLDPQLEAPIVTGVDSISSLGIEESSRADVTNISKAEQPGTHAKKIRKYLSEHVGRFNLRHMLLMLASHQTAKLNMGVPARMVAKGEEVNSRAKEAISIYATYEITMESKRWRDAKDTTQVLGEVIEIFTTKNKMSPRNRKLNIYMRTAKGFDWAQTDMIWLMTNPASPFVDPVLQAQFGTLTMRAGKVTCPILSPTEKYDSVGDFLTAFYANTDLVMAIREALRIRGWGFAFETSYDETPEEEASGEAGETAPAEGEEGVLPEEE